MVDGDDGVEVEQTIVTATSRKLKEMHHEQNGSTNTNKVNPIGNMYQGHQINRDTQNPPLASGCSLLQSVSINATNNNSRSNESLTTSVCQHLTAIHARRTDDCREKQDHPNQKRGRIDSIGYIKHGRDSLKNSHKSSCLKGKGNVCKEQHTQPETVLSANLKWFKCFRTTTVYFPSLMLCALLIIVHLHFVVWKTLQGTTVIDVTLYQKKEVCVVDFRGQSRFFVLKNECSSSRVRGSSKKKNSRLKSSSSRLVVAWEAPLAGGLTAGFANEAVSFLCPLSTHIEIMLPDGFNADEGFVSNLDPREKKVLMRLRARQYAGIINTKPQIYLSQWPPGRLFAGKMEKFGVTDTTYRISRAMYEATHLPTDWQSNFDQIDEFWVPSAWNKNILVQDYGIPPEDVFIVEEGLDAHVTFNPKLYCKHTSRAKIYPSDAQQAFIFLSVFKWEDRKAPLKLIWAFLDEFKEEKDVMLFLRTDIPGHQSLNHEMQREGSTFDSRVRLLPRQERYRYQEMFAAADAFILASHGEGWGRPILEAMAMEVPLIATNWSGPTQFLNVRCMNPEINIVTLLLNKQPVTVYVFRWTTSNHDQIHFLVLAYVLYALSYILPLLRKDDVALLLPVHQLEQARIPGAPPNALWASIDIAYLQHLMRKLYEDRQAAHQRAMRGRQHVVQKYDQKIVAQQALVRLQNAHKKQLLGIFPRKQRIKKNTRK